MDKRVLIVDYGVGNLLSVRRAFEHCGALVDLSGDPAVLAKAPRVVLPGVGAFGDCATALRRRNLDEAVLKFVETGRPLLGICVGMQMLFDASEEFGHYDGLGIIPGIVQAIPPMDTDSQPLKIPHIGWSGLVPPEGADAVYWTGTVLDGVAPGTAAYFVHSFQGRPVDTAHRLADAVYGGRRIAAAVRKGSVLGTQFHPEKSGKAGLAIIQNFLEIP